MQGTGKNARHGAIDITHKSRERTELQLLIRMRVLTGKDPQRMQTQATWDKVFHSCMLGKFVSVQNWLRIYINFDFRRKLLVGLPPLLLYSLVDDVAGLETFHAH